MTSAETTTWAEANQRHLTAALAEVRALLEAHAARADNQTLPRADAPPERHFPEMEARPASASALEILSARLGLSSFERTILLLSAGIELDASFAALCARAQGDPARPYPTFGLALALFPAAHWSALTPDAPLRHWRLIELVTQPGASLTSSPLRIDERVLHFLAGLQHLDERLVGLIEPAPREEELVASHLALAERILAAWVGGGETLPVIQLCGADEGSRRAVAAAGCASVGLHLSALAADLIPASASELDALLRLWEREAALTTSALYVDAEAIDLADRHNVATVTRLLERCHAPLLLGTHDRWRPLRRPLLTLDVGKPTHQEQRALWQAMLGEAAVGLNGHLDGLVAQFQLSAPGIRASAQEALSSGVEREALAERLWDASRAQARARLDDLAQRIEPVAAWDDLVLPEAERRLLREIAAHVAQRTRVYETWGFGAASSRGLGISALFAGASGTGKTMAAEVLANALRLDLYRIDLSSVVSKYIGETEKNLRRVFDAAEHGGAILFFDEADALFGKRSEVKDSHDRYANIEINYLLQRMESYRGLAVLATNRKGDLDPAFLRRIRFVVNFPFPDSAQRAEIWRRVFPARTPTDGLDVGKLSRLNIAGGNIRNIALNAAFLAADAGEPVRMSHLLRAARSEYAKIEKPLTDAETGGWQ